MNKELLKEIIKHIFSNFLIIPSNFIDQNKSKSLINKDYLLNKTLSFNIDGIEVKRGIWGCQLVIGQKEFKILLADCGQDNVEYCLLVQLKDSPAYGVYFDDSIQENRNMIACNINNNWIECNTYLQATFLAGMEQLKELVFNWNKCKDYSEQYNLLLSFIKYHDSCFEDLEEEHEG